MNYGVFHIARILWWVLVNEKNIDARHEAMIMDIVRSEGPVLQEAYTRATAILSEIVSENNESLINLNNYFKKSQSQQNINQHLQKLLEISRRS